MKKLILALILIVTMFNLSVYAFTQDDVDNAYFEGWQEGYDEALMENEDAIKTGNNVINNKEHSEAYQEGYDAGYADAEQELKESADAEAARTKRNILIAVACCVALFVFVYFRAK